jgi:hypothetical protein
VKLITKTLALRLQKYHHSLIDLD